MVFECKSETNTQWKGNKQYAWQRRKNKGDCKNCMVVSQRSKVKSKCRMEKSLNRRKKTRKMEVRYNHWRRKRKEGSRHHGCKTRKRRKMYKSWRGKRRKKKQYKHGINDKEIKLAILHSIKQDNQESSILRSGLITDSFKKLKKEIESGRLLTCMLTCLLTFIFMLTFSFRCM